VKRIIALLVGDRVRELLGRKDLVVILGSLIMDACYLLTSDLNLTLKELYLGVFAYTKTLLEQVVAMYSNKTY
jgi:hypothetical protein